MSVGNNFVDLRISNAGISGSNEESVWPAFTDIMTVVLMIFLMSLVAFLIRNTQLLDELQTTLIEKDQISQQAILSSEENDALQAQLAMVRERILSLESTLQTVTGTRDELQQTLEAREKAVRELETEIALLTRLRDQLSNTNSELFKELDLSRLALAGTEKTLSETEQNLSKSEQNLSYTRQNLAQTEIALAKTEAEFSDTKNTLNEKISLLLAAKAGLLVAKEKTEQSLSDAEKQKIELNRQIISLTEQIRLVSEKLDSQTTVNETLDTELEDQRVIMAGLEISKEELEEKLTEMSKNLSRLQRLYNLRGKVVLDLRSELVSGTQKFKSLQEEYDSLDEEYRKLIRPARSPAGKYVVDVYFAKQNGQPEYRLREPNQETAQTLSLEELDARLSQLKEEHKQQLYTKVRIDDKSGIGFNEAWQFTQKVLAEYDYYSHDYSDLVPESEE